MGAATVTQMPKQLTLEVGGATVDTSTIGSIQWAAEVRNVGQREFDKGDDVELRIVARVVGVDIKDRYDAHGNVAETIRQHELRIDELTVGNVNPAVYNEAPDE